MDQDLARSGVQSAFCRDRAMTVSFTLSGNQSDEAFAWLDHAYAQRDGALIETKVDPLLKNLDRDPRYR